MGDHHDFINSGNWWKVLSSSSSSTSSSMRVSPIETDGCSPVFHDKLHSLASDHHDHQHMIGLGLSSQSPVDQWNHSLLRGDSKAETSFGEMLQENLNLDATSNTNANMMTSSTSSYHQLQESVFSRHNHQALWRDPQINKTQNMTNSNCGLYLDHQFSPHGSSSNDSRTVTCQGFVVDNSSNNLYATTPNSSSATFNHHQEASGFNLPGSSDQQPSINQQSNLGYSLYGSSNGNYEQMASATWFVRSSPPKPHSPLRFSNNATFWSPADVSVNAGLPHHDASSSFFPALQPPQIHAPSFVEQPKSISEIRDSSSISEVKRGGGDQPAAKRAKSQAASPSPALKTRKEKIGDRVSVSALQQLVSPFGKTDKASVLSDAIEYIKFLHQQISALSNPYMKSGVSLQHQQSDHHCKEVEAQEEVDLRSKGLCLVPVSSTFPLINDTTVEFWTPTFGGTFR